MKMVKMIREDLFVVFCYYTVQTCLAAFSDYHASRFRGI